MREILFRGKRTHSRQWAFGFYTQSPSGNFYITETSCGVASPKTVEPETVGQFVGLTDKNGKNIFEGDIVRVLGNQQVDDWKNVDYVALIAFLDGGFCAIDGTVEEHGFRRYALARMDFSLEIIGNQFDNPEFLENP